MLAGCSLPINQPSEAQTSPYFSPAAADRPRSDTLSYLLQYSFLAHARLPLGEPVQVDFYQIYAEYLRLNFTEADIQMET